MSSSVDDRGRCWLRQSGLLVRKQRNALGIPTSRLESLRPADVTHSRCDTDMERVTGSTLTCFRMNVSGSIKRLFTFEREHLTIGSLIE